MQRLLIFASVLALTACEEAMFASDAVLRLAIDKAISGAPMTPVGQSALAFACAEARVVLSDGTVIEGMALAARYPRLRVACEATKR